MKQSLYCDPELCCGKVKMAEKVNDKVIVKDRRNRERHILIVDTNRINTDNSQN